jgi:transposase
MKAYSLDLRQRVVDAYEGGEGSLAELAALFGVSIDFIKKMLRLFRRGESLEPKPHGGGAPPALNDSQRAVLRAAVEKRPDATLKELQEVLVTQCQVAVSESTICRELQKLNLPRKKKLRGKRTQRTQTPGVWPQGQGLGRKPIHLRR